MRQVLPGLSARPLPGDCYEVDLSSAESVKELHQLLNASENARVGGAINFLGCWPSDRTSGQEDREASSAVAEWTFNVVKEFVGDLRASAGTGGGWFMNVTALGGQFGLDDRPITSLAGAGSLGITKTLRREYPSLRIKNIDVDPQQSDDVLATMLLQELAVVDDLVEVGWNRGGRWRPALKATRTPRDSAPLEIDRESVILVTGGAYGVTAAVARGLASAVKPRLILVGRSPLPTVESTRTEGLNKASLRSLFFDESRVHGKCILPVEIERSVNRTLKDRDIRANLKACAAAGASVEYHSLDVRDSEAFGELIDGLYERFGRIDGVVHGAGIIEDKRIVDKPLDSFVRVFRTKVDSSLTLARKLRPETLKYLVFFGSASGRFGNIGQVDYSAANEVLNKLADQLNHRWPGRVVCINWGPWDGGMVSAELRQLYATAGVELIPVEEGVAAFLSEIRRTDRVSAEVLIEYGVDCLERKANRR